MRRLGSPIALIFLILCSSCTPAGYQGNLTVHIVDDNAQPVPEAAVAIVGGGTREEGKTDKNGLFGAAFHNLSGDVDLVVRKDGFYPIYRRSYVFASHTNNHLLPWNPLVELQFHKIGKPVPMFVKSVQDYLPVLNESIGYDLLLGDWVQPYGKGVTNDFIFKAERLFVDDMNYSGSLTLNFSDAQNGLILRQLFYRDDYNLRLAAIAPATGYDNHWVFSMQSSKNPVDGLRKDYSSFSEDDNYYFRVRSKTNESGQVTSAMYGKIYWGIRYFVGNTNINHVAGRTNPMPWVQFQYFLNPDETRNTEFDTRQNLCPHPGLLGKGH